MSSPPGPDPYLKPPITSIQPRTLPVSKSEADQLTAIGYGDPDDPTPPVNGTGDDRPKPATPLATILGDLDAELAAKRGARTNRPEEEPGMLDQMMRMLGMGQ